MNSMLLLFGKIILWLGVTALAVGLIGAVSPWTIDLYIYFFPAESTAYDNDSAGGPYPELGFAALAVLGFWVAISGIAMMLVAKLWNNPSNGRSHLPISKGPKR